MEETSKAKEYWQMWSEWIAEAYAGELAPAVQREEAATDGNYFGRADMTSYKALKMLALGHPLGEELSDFVLELLEEAEARDDRWFYGEWGETTREEERMGETYTVVSYGVPDDGSEPYRDADLGRALRARYLFVFRWLTRKERDLEVLNLAIERMKLWIDLQFNLPKDSPEKRRRFDGIDAHFHELLLWAIEAGRGEVAMEYYRKYVHPEGQVSLPPADWREIEDCEHLYYLMAAHESGEAELARLLAQLTEKIYQGKIAEIVETGEEGHLDVSLLGLAYLRAKLLGRPANPRELLVQIREDSLEPGSQPRLF